MKRYKITPTLINAFNYVWDLKTSEENLSSATKIALDNFIGLLKKEDSPMSPSIIAGLEFEKKCYEGVVEPSTEEIIRILRGGTYQVRKERNINVEGYNFLLVGVLDYLKGIDIYDIKKSITNTYTPLKYIKSCQHSAYFYLVPATQRFTYLFNDKNGQTFKEQYLRSDAKPIQGYIMAFIEGLKNMGLWDLYTQYWEVKN